MSEPERLSRRVATLAGCSRSEAEQYVEGGWVTVDGQVIERPQHRVTTEQVDIDPAARLAATEPATLLLHKPTGIEPGPPAIGLATAASHWPMDPSGVRPLKRHLAHLSMLMPLDVDASGLVVLSQDGRVWRRLTEDADRIEQEFVVEVTGEIAPYGLHQLGSGLRWRGRALPPCKVSWQSETRLRFAIKSVQAGQLRDMCRQVGLDVVSIRRLRVGKIALGKLPPGQWRYVATGDRF